MLIVVVLTFVSVFLLVASTYLAIVAARESPKAVLKRRLRRMARSGGGEGLPEDLRSEILREIPPLDRVLARISLLARTERVLDHAGLKITLTTFLVVVLVAVIAGFLILYLITRSLLFGAMGSGAAFASILLFLGYWKSRRVDRFTEQFPDALGIISRSVRAGHSLVTAIELVSQETEQPTCDLFRTVYEQQKLGLRVTEALVNMTERIESLDLRFFVTAVSINMDVGGNLAEVLDKLGDTIRERLKIRRQVRVYTAQGRLSGYVLALLPVAAFFLFQSIMPGYEDPLLREKSGNYILAAAFAAQLAGFFSIRKIVNIRI